MQRCLWVAAIAALLITGITNGYAKSRWGANYFPNTSLITHEGKTVQFFDDLIEDKIVVINFIYTTCPDTCPLETAQLTRVQGILGDRLGKDIFFYSITIDPDNDSPEVLKAYREKFGAQWTFLTGNKQEIITLRRKLGLYIENNEGGEFNHNISMIIGNQTTGRWMKRSPFENPYVLADQIGNWLTGWKSPQHVKDYANAPKLRTISDGEKLYRTRCLSCHTIDGSDDKMIGPDLLGVTQRRDRKWLIRWLKEPDKMLAEQDPIAIGLYKQFNNVPMPNMRLSRVDVMDLLKYMEQETTARWGAQDTDMASAIEPAEDVVAVMNAWIREAMPDSTVNAGYMTLVNVGSEDVKLVGVESQTCAEVELHEMTMANGMMEMHELSELIVPAGGQAQFKPGGKHLMLKDPDSHLTSGQKVELTLVFDSGKRQTVTVAVADK